MGTGTEDRDTGKDMVVGYMFLAGVRLVLLLMAPNYSNLISTVWYHSSLSWTFWPSLQSLASDNLIFGKLRLLAEVGRHLLVSS